MATVLVDPRVLADVELASMALDLRVWPVRTAPTCADGARAAFQLRRALLMRHRGAWDLAADWVPVWIGFGDSWRDGDEPPRRDVHLVPAAAASRGVIPPRPRAAGSVRGLTGVRVSG